MNVNSCDKFILRLKGGESVGFKIPTWLEEKKQEWHDLKYIKIDDTEIHVSEFKDKSITPEMKSRMRMNSYAREDLPPKLTDEALIETVNYYVAQCSTPKYPCSTYDEALIHKLVPELVKRFQDYELALSHIANFGSPESAAKHLQYVAEQALAK